ncbi:MAG: 5'-methylthioadenosine/adenosylhomocysteine nucleosidase [Muribaculaceae bacterium]
MTIGIIVAMSKELNLLLPLLEGRTSRSIDHFDFHTGIVGSNHVVAMQCGIGKVNAALGALTMIKNYNVDLIISSGVAGGADTSVNVMDIVVADKVAYHDVYCGPESTIGAVQGLPLYYNTRQQLLSLVEKDAHIHFGLICSGDQFIDTSSQLNAIKANFANALAVDMESAAIAQTCHLYSKDFLSLRVISDSPGANHNNARQYNDFWAEAPQHTFNILHKLILNIH